MTEKQKIEVGQVWRVRAGNNYGTVVGVSPAWIKLDDDVDVRSFRRGDFIEHWIPFPEVDSLAEVEMPADPDFSEVAKHDESANVNEHASMKAVVAAFNAQTGMNLKESQAWLLLVNVRILIDEKDNGTDIISGADYFRLYEESRDEE